MNSPKLSQYRVDRNCPDFVRIKRTWKERLFTLPWRPFQTHKNGDPLAYKRDDVWLVSPRTYAALDTGKLAATANHKEKV